MLGWALVFFLEVVSRPHREEKRLFRLLVERDAAWARLLTPHSLRAATWGDSGATAPSTRAKLYLHGTGEKLHYCAAQEKRQKGGNLFGIAIKKRG